MASGCFNPRKPIPRPELAPLERFDRPRLREAFGSDPKGRGYWDVLSGRYFAGRSERPTGAGLEAALRSEDPDREQRIDLYALFGCMQLWEYRTLIHRAGVPVYDLVRALHFSGARPTDIVFWLNQFADPPWAPGRFERARVPG